LGEGIAKARNRSDLLTQKQTSLIWRCMASSIPEQQFLLFFSNRQTVIFLGDRAIFSKNLLGDAKMNAKIYKVCYSCMENLSSF